MKDNYWWDFGKIDLILIFMLVLTLGIKFVGDKIV